MMPPPMEPAVAVTAILKPWQLGLLSSLRTMHSSAAGWLVCKAAAAKAEVGKSWGRAGIIWLTCR